MLRFHLGMPDVEVPVGLRGETCDHLPPGDREVLGQLLRRVGDPHEAAIAEVDRGMDLVVWMQVSEW